jgi:hypothetical protein
MQQTPGSVLAGRACSSCWRPLESTFYSQTLDNVTRYLCTGCATRFFPVLPAGMEGANLVHLDAKAGLAEAERKVRAAALKGNKQTS